MDSPLEIVEPEVNDVNEVALLHLCDEEDLENALAEYTSNEGLGDIAKIAFAAVIGAAVGMIVKLIANRIGKGTGGSSAGSDKYKTRSLGLNMLNKQIHTVILDGLEIDILMDLLDNTNTGLERINDSIDATTVLLNDLHKVAAEYNDTGDPKALEAWGKLHGSFFKDNEKVFLDIFNADGIAEVLKDLNGSSLKPTKLKEYNKSSIASQYFGGFRILLSTMLSKLKLPTVTNKAQVRSSKQIVFDSSWLGNFQKKGKESMVLFQDVKKKSNKLADTAKKLDKELENVTPAARKSAGIKEVYAGGKMITKVSKDLLGAVAFYNQIIQLNIWLETEFEMTRAVQLSNK